VDGILVGEGLLKYADVGAALRALVAPAMNNGKLKIEN